MGERLKCLDGLRGLLAVYVLVSHMAPFGALPSWAAGAMSHGEAAVDVFFILSGLVIVRSMRSFGADRQGFLLARAARTLPAFLVVFMLAVPIQPLPTALPWMPWIGEHDPARAMWSTGWPRHWASELGAHLVMAHGLFPNFALPYVWVSFLGAAWSLSTEWQFYGLVALSGPSLEENGGLRRLIVFLWLLAVSALLWRAFTPDALHFSRAFLPNKAAYFALGIASASALGARRPGPLILPVLASLGLCLWDGGLTKLGAPSVWLLCLAAQALPSAPILGWIARVLRSEIPRALGAISYSIYLVNEPVQKILALGLAPLAGGDEHAFAVLWLPAAIALPLAAAFLLHRWVEAPGLRAGRALLPRPLLVSGG